MNPDAELRPVDPATDGPATDDSADPAADGAPSDPEYVERLLAANDLPVADLAETLDCLYCWEADGERVGVGGLEPCGGDRALLRSVAVEKRARGEGHGRALCERLLDEAATRGCEEVYLLTTTAPGFFADLGFAEVDRESVPAEVRETTEFAELCPDAAVCMKRDVKR